MPKAYIGNRKYTLYIGGRKVRRGYKGSQLIYSGTIHVTYNVGYDSENKHLVYTEEVEEGESCLAPTSFDPKVMMKGYTFVGWRKDDTPTSDVYKKLIAGSDDVVLYAVYKQDYTVTLTTALSSGSGISKSIKKTTVTHYYNNGRTVYPTYKPTYGNVNNYTILGWNTNNTSTDFTLDLNVGGTATITKNTALNPVYEDSNILKKGRCIILSNTSASFGLFLFISVNSSNINVFCL